MNDEIEKPCSKNKSIWVLWWRYHDYSGLGIVRAYNYEERAKLDLEIATMDSTKVWLLEEIPLIHGDL